MPGETLATDIVERFFCQTHLWPLFRGAGGLYLGQDFLWAGPSLTERAGQYPQRNAKSSLHDRSYDILIGINDFEPVVSGRFVTGASCQVPAIFLALAPRLKIGQGVLFEFVEDSGCLVALFVTCVAIPSPVMVRATNHAQDPMIDATVYMSSSVTSQFIV